VKDGVVDLWGVARSDAERTAVRVAAEAMPGVRAVKGNLARSGHGEAWLADR
jgi:osmotically-inducible protein OsmY